MFVFPLSQEIVFYLKAINTGGTRDIILHLHPDNLLPTNSLSEEEKTGRYTKGKRGGKNRRGKMRRGRKKKLKKERKECSELKD